MAGENQIGYMLMWIWNISRCKVARMDVPFYVSQWWWRFSSYVMHVFIRAKASRISETLWLYCPCGMDEQQLVEGMNNNWWKGWTTTGGRDEQQEVEGMNNNWWKGCTTRGGRDEQQLMEGMNKKRWKGWTTRGGRDEQQLVEGMNNKRWKNIYKNMTVRLVPQFFLYYFVFLCLPFTVIHFLSPN